MDNLEIFGDDVKGPQYEIATLLNLPKIKSKHFRKFFITDTQDITKLINVNKRYNWAGNKKVEFAREVMYQKTWTLSYLPMHVKQFSVRLVNNTNKLNAGLNHFVSNIDDKCSYCIINNEESECRENTEHFFYQCKHTTSFAKKYFDKFFPTVGFSKDWLLLGAPSTFSLSLMSILNIELMFLNLFLFRFRLTHNNPTIDDYNKFISLTRKIVLRNNNYKKSFDKIYKPFDNG